MIWPTILRGTLVACALLGVTCAGASTAAADASLPSRATIEREYFEVLRTLDPQLPGRGPDALHRDPRPVPNAIAGVLNAEARRWNGTRSRSALRRIRVSGRWLLRNRDLNRNGIVGWGLPAAFERNGELAPAHQEYTVTTAGIIGTLMNWIKYDRGAPRAEIIRVIKRALAPYLATPPMGRTPTGFFAYSFFPADLPHDVYNVGTVAAGQIQRFTGLLRRRRDRRYKRRLQAVASKQVRILVRARRRSPRGNWYWVRTSRPTNPPSRPNALGHALAVSAGIHQYWRFGGRRGRRVLGTRRLVGHIGEFFGTRFLYTSPVWESRRDERAFGSAGVSGGVGYALQERAFRRYLPRLMRELLSYEYAPGLYATGLTVGPRTTVRGQAGMLTTFAHYLWDTDRPPLQIPER